MIMLIQPLSILVSVLTGVWPGDEGNTAQGKDRRRFEPATDG